jgi:hypothetical protein
MNAPQRGALMLVRVLALSLIGWSVVELALYWVICHHKRLPVEIIPCLVRALPLLAGLAVLVRAKALAEWISNILD